ncbi:MAG TPA: DEAD/DEAH box helicase, partial [Cytophagales bacterium]|nr:DEAD/DEAH box helicase [Cytophagales bacterium]
PYRLELLGDEIESIRTFDPDTQLSLEHKKIVSIIPNVQTKLLQETRESFFNFLPEQSTIWVQRLDTALQALDKNFKKAASEFDKILEMNNGSSIVNKPEYLFETAQSFEKGMQEFAKVFLASSANQDYAEVLEFKSSPQPSFNKDFQLIAKDLYENQTKGYRNFIFADSGAQHDKLVTIFDEINPEVRTFHVGTSIREGYVDHLLKIVCYTDHQLFERFHNYRNKEKASKSKAITLKELKTLQPGDYVVHQDHGIARFVGLEKVMLGSNKEQEGIRLVFRDDDLMVVSIHALHKISKYSGKDGAVPTMSKLGSPEWENKKKSAKKKVKDIAKELISLYAKRKAAPGYAFTRDTFLQAELETSFLYEDTPDQAKATKDVKEDMEKPHPMDRLVCGDVGFGKTEVAIRAAFKAVCDGKQVAVLVPTTVLAMQHYKTFRDRLEKFPVKTEYINRFRTTGQIKETLQRVKEGKTNILIGTQRILSKDVEFKDLGLLIIDEEQKFGVSTKEKLKQFKFNVDTLTLTATPIPRTLHFSLMGARDLSVIATPPPNRQPVTTEIHVFDKAVIRDAVSNEIKRGGQVFFIHNRVADLDGMA